MVPTCHCQQCAPEGPSTEGLVSVICCGFISAAARIFHQSGKTWIYWTSRLCSARAEGKDCHQCTGLNRASQSRLFNAVSLSEDTTPGREKKKPIRLCGGFPLRWVHCSAVRMRSSAAAEQPPACGAARDTCRRLRQPWAAGGDDNQADQSPRTLQMAPFIGDR